MSSEFTMQARMHLTTCYKCGVAFAFPEQYYHYRQRDGRKFWCPNGHGQVYSEAKEKVEERRKKLLDLHNQEQAEARAAEGKKPTPAPADPQPAGKVPAVPEPIPSGHNRLRCPCCPLTFVFTTGYQKHYRRKHAKSEQQTENT